MSKANLITAIVGAYNSTVALNGLTGVIHYGDAPDTADRPYAVLTEVSTAAEQTSSSWDDMILFQFTFFSAAKSPKEVLDLYALLIATFDNAVISVVGGTLVSMIRSGEAMLRDPDGDGWQYSVDYRAHYERQK